MGGHLSVLTNIQSMSRSDGSSSQYLLLHGGSDMYIHVRPELQADLSSSLEDRRLLGGCWILESPTEPLSLALKQLIVLL